MSVRYVYANLLEKLAELLKVTEQVALFLLIGCGALLVLIIALVVILIVVGNKKKKAKLIKQEVVVNQEKELEEVKEVEPETTSVEETPVEEATPVVEEIPVEEVEEEAVETKSVRVSIGKFEVFPVNDVFLYRLKASNGEILVTSEIYKTLKGAIAAVDTVKKNIETGTLSIYEDKHGLWQFKLFAVNKRLLVASANYQTQARCESAANSFKKFALVSPVVELEEDPEHLMEEIKMLATADKKGGKLHIIEEYLKTYATVLKNQKVKKIYVDGFAGSGKTELKSNSHTQDFETQENWKKDWLSDEKTKQNYKKLLPSDFDTYLKKYKNFNEEIKKQEKTKEEYLKMGKELQIPMKDLEIMIDLYATIK